MIPSMPGRVYRDAVETTPIADYEPFMRVAIDEARSSLREGNKGFGAAVVAEGEIVARAHDLEETDGDPTAHAELLAIRLASQRRGRDLVDCALVATHEPCPMCATAAVWSGIREVAFGYSIAEAIAAGRRRIPIGAAEIFERAGEAAMITAGVLHNDCAVLYRREVRDEVRRLRGAGPEGLETLCEAMTARRIEWARSHPDLVRVGADDPLEAGYRLMLAKLRIGQDEAPIVERSSDRIVLHSRNFCPTLEACVILGLDTQVVCRAVTERPMEALLRQLHPGLRFSRNYDALRPQSGACEETISLDV